MLTNLKNSDRKHEQVDDDDGHYKVVEGKDLTDRCELSPGFFNGHC